MSMMAPGASASPKWRIIQITAGQGQDATGRYVGGKMVTYQLASGQAGTIFVPDGQDTPESVKAAVQASAANLAALHNLTSES